MEEMPWALPRRIISARETPGSAVLMAPAMVRNLFPPESRSSRQPAATSTTVAALKCRNWRSTNRMTGPAMT